MVNGAITDYNTTTTHVSLSVFTDTDDIVPVLSFAKGTDELTVQAAYNNNGVRLYPELGYYYKESTNEYYRVLHNGYLQVLNIPATVHSDMKQTISFHYLTAPQFITVGPVIRKNNVYQVTFLLNHFSSSAPVSPINFDIAYPVVSRFYSYSNGIFTAVDQTMFVGVLSEMRNVVTSTYMNNFLRTRQMYGITLIDITTNEEMYLVHENEEVFLMCTGDFSEGTLLSAATLSDIIPLTDSFTGTLL